jgi:hypothetical protein
VWVHSFMLPSSFGVRSLLLRGPHNLRASWNILASFHTDVKTKGFSVLDKTFPAFMQGDSLQLSLPDCHVEIISAEKWIRGDGIRTQLILYHPEPYIAAKYFEDLNVTISVETDGNRRRKFRVLHTGSPTTIRWSQPKTWPNIFRRQPVLLFRALVPEYFDADLSVTNGDVYINHLAGSAKVRTTGGHVVIDSVDMPTRKSVRPSASSPYLRGMSGPFIAAAQNNRRDSLSTDDAELEANAGPSVDIETLSGDVTLMRAAGECRLRTAEGSVQVTMLRGSLLTNCTRGGDIDAKLLQSSTAALHTTMGDVNLEISADLPLEVDLTGSKVKLHHSHFSGKLAPGRVIGRLYQGGQTVYAITQGDIYVREMNIAGREAEAVR